VKVFLIQDVANLGKAGEIKEVKNSFALNFLLPKKIAVLPSDPSAKGLAEEKMAKKKKEAEKIEEQRALAQRINGQKFVILTKADKNGHLYGSIGPKEFAKETGLSENLFKEHYKEIGEYSLEVSIADEIVKIQIEIKNI